MGAKLSNLSWNLKSPTSANQSIDNFQQLNTDVKPEILIDSMVDDPKQYYTPDLPIEINRESRSSSTVDEPKIFPKINHAESQCKSVPVSKTSYRINPILQKGEKLSDTHYWFLTEPKHKRCHSARLKRNPPELYINASTISQINSSRYNNDGNNNEPDLPYDRDEHISVEYAKYRSVKRGNSEADKFYNLHRGLVIRLMLSIPIATEMECKSVLIGANWDFNLAEKRLKIDMLHRKGYLNQQMCTKLLEKNEWDYKLAETEAERDFSSSQPVQPLSQPQSSSLVYHRQHSTKSSIL